MITDPARDSGVPVALTLADDLNDLPLSDLKKEVARVCSAYGTVVKVVVHRSHAHRSVRAFALVDMSLLVEAERLAAAFNRQAMGITVLLLLKPRPAS